MKYKWIPCLHLGIMSTCLIVICEPTEGQIVNLEDFQCQAFWVAMWLWQSTVPSAVKWGPTGAAEDKLLIPCCVNTRCWYCKLSASCSFKCFSTFQCEATVSEVITGLTKTAAQSPNIIRHLKKSWKLLSLHFPLRVRNKSQVGKMHPVAGTHMQSQSFCHHF